MPESGLNNIVQNVKQYGILQSEISFKDKQQLLHKGSVTVTDLHCNNNNDVVLCFSLRTENINTENIKNSKELTVSISQLIENQAKEVESLRSTNENIFHNSPVAMWINDAATFRFLDVNELAITEYGYSKEEFMLMTLADIRPESEKDRFLNFDRSKLKEYDKHNIGIWKHKRKDGSIMDVEITNHPLIYNGVEARLSLLNNVTGRLAAEHALEKSEKRFKTIIEKGNDIVTLFDKDFKVIYRSPSSNRLTGWNDEDVMNLSGVVHLHPDDLKYVQENLMELMSHPGIYFNVCIRLKTKAGHYIWVEGMICNMLNDDDINAIVFNYRDVTERKLQEEKLAASEQRFKALIENGNDIVSIYDSNMVVIYRSPSASKLLGWTDEETIGYKATSNIHPDDIAYAVEKIKEIKEHPGIPYQVNLRMLQKNGSTIWLEGTIVNLLEDINVQAIVFNYRNITDKKAVAEELSAKENQFRNLIDRISDAFLSLDNDFQITYVNNVMETLLQCKPGVLVGKHLTEKFNTINDRYFFSIITDVHNTKHPKRFDCFSNVMQKWISGTIYPSSTGLTLFFRDNSDRKKLESELQEQQHNEQIRLVSATLEAQEKERNAIGLELHDNVNQILVGTIMILSLLKKHPERTALIEESIVNMKRAVQENRNIAHILVSPDLETKIFHEQIEYLGNEMLLHAGIKTIINIEEDSTALLQKDQQVALYRIVQEQFTNIVKYAEASEVIITVEAKENKVLKLTIADNGKGMNKQTVTNGIGLKNIGSRLSVFNGNMNIKTEPGNGFALVVEIPVEIEENSGVRSKETGGKSTINNQTENNY